MRKISQKNRFISLDLVLSIVWLLLHIPERNDYGIKFWSQRLRAQVCYPTKWLSVHKTPRDGVKQRKWRDSESLALTQTSGLLSYWFYVNIESILMKYNIIGLFWKIYYTSVKSVKFELPTQGKNEEHNNTILLFLINSSLSSWNETNLVQSILLLWKTSRSSWQLFSSHSNVFTFNCNFRIELVKNEIKIFKLTLTLVSPNYVTKEQNRI